MLRGNGRDASLGWPTAPRLEAPHDQWIEATSLDEQRCTAREMQVVGMDELPCIPLGYLYRSTALAADLLDRVEGMPFFWSIRRA